VLLDAPATPVCRPDCAGVAPGGGVNRTGTACSCAAPPADHRWSALDQLLDLPDGD